MDDEGRGLNTRLLRVGDVVDIHLVAVLLGPAGVHAQQHLRPVRGIHATGAGADVDQRLALVVFAGEHGGDLQGFDGGPQRRALLLRHRRGVLGRRRILRGLLLSHVVEHREVLQPLA